MRKYDFQPRNSSSIWIRCCTSQGEKLSSVQHGSHLDSLWSCKRAGQLWKSRAWLNLPVTGFFHCKIKLTSLLYFLAEGRGILHRDADSSTAQLWSLVDANSAPCRGFVFLFLHPSAISAASGDTGMSKDWVGSLMTYRSEKWASPSSCWTRRQRFLPVPGGTWAGKVSGSRAFPQQLYCRSPSSQNLVL